MSALTAIASIGGLTAALTSLLVLAHRTLHVEEDPRIDEVEALLPHANCGACGMPGCRPFAEALVRGEVSPAECTVSDDAGRAEIASFLGVDVGRATRRVARLACAGGTNVARHRARYDGPQTCRSAALVAGGGKSCFWGCLGLADCEQACGFDAIAMNRHDLPVVDEAKCTACGDCVDACPKDLFSLQSVADRLWVACRSLEAGDGVLEECEVGCTACGRCAMDAPGLIAMEQNLPVVAYGTRPLSREPIERCPTGAIVWIDAVHGPQTGAAAPAFTRKSHRPDRAT